MIIIILVIYFIILIIIEFLTIILSNNKKAKLVKLTNIDKFSDLINKYNLIQEKSIEDLDIKNYIGSFYVKNYNGFFINLDKWNLLESDILYNFSIPVNIKIIKIKNNENIEYFIENYK